MPQVALGVEQVAHPLLQCLDVGEAAVALALPYDPAVAADLEHAAGAGDQRHLAQLLGEGGEQLLRHPGGAQQPVALAAVGDREARLRLRHAPQDSRPSGRVPTGRKFR